MAYITLDIDGKKYNVQLAEIEQIYYKNGIDYTESKFYVKKFAKPIRYYIPELKGNEIIKMIFDGQEITLQHVQNNFNLLTKCGCICSNNKFSYFGNLVGYKAEIIAVTQHQYILNSNGNYVIILDFISGLNQYLRTAVITGNTPIPDGALDSRMSYITVSQNNRMMAMCKIQNTDNDVYRCFGSIGGNEYVTSEFAYAVADETNNNLGVWGSIQTAYIRRYIWDESEPILNKYLDNFPHFKNGNYISGEEPSYRLYQTDIGRNIYEGIHVNQKSTIYDAANKYKKQPVANPDEDAPVIPPIPDEDEDGNQDKGGDGDRDDTSDEIPFPTPDISGVSDLISLYVLSQNQTRLLGNALWTKNFADNILSLNTNPLDAIIFFNAYDIPIPTNGNEILQIGNVKFDSIAPEVIDNPFVVLKCGSIKINEYYGSWLDYNTDISIYLPHIGYRKLDSEMVMNSELTLQYTVDVLSGKGLALLKINKGILNSILYQFEGDFAYSIPLSGRDFSNYNLGWITALSQLSISKAISTQKESNNILDSGNLGSNISFAGVKIPYLIFTREIPFNDAWFNYNMYTWEGNALLGTLSGETRIDCDIELNIPNAYKEEIDDLIAWMRKGIIL